MFDIRRLGVVVFCQKQMVKKLRRKDGRSGATLGPSWGFGLFPVATVMRPAGRSVRGRCTSIANLMWNLSVSDGGESRRDGTLIGRQVIVEVAALVIWDRWREASYLPL